DCGPRVPRRTAQLGHENGWAERRVVARARAGVDVEVARAARPRAREVQRGDAGRFVLEDGRAGIVGSRVHDAAQVLCRLPAQVVPLILPSGYVEIGSATAAGLEAVKIEMVLVGRKRRGRLVRVAVDVGPKVLQRTP